MGLLDRLRGRATEEQDITEMDDDEFWEMVEDEISEPPAVDGAQDPTPKQDQTEDDEQYRDSLIMPEFREIVPGDGAVPFGRGRRYVPGFRDTLRLVKTVRDEMLPYRESREFRIFLDDNKFRNPLPQPRMPDNLDAGDFEIMAPLSIKPRKQSKMELLCSKAKRTDWKLGLGYLINQGYVTDTNPFTNLSQLKVSELKEEAKAAGLVVKGTKTDIIADIVDQSPETVERLMRRCEPTFTTTSKGEDMLDRFPYFREMLTCDFVHYLNAYQVNLLMHDNPGADLYDSIDGLYTRLAFMIYADPKPERLYYMNCLSMLALLEAASEPERAVRIALHALNTAWVIKMMMGEEQMMRIILSTSGMTLDEAVRIMEDEKKYVIFPYNKQKDEVIQYIWDKLSQEKQ